MLNFFLILESTFNFLIYASDDVLSIAFVAFYYTKQMHSVKKHFKVIEKCIYIPSPKGNYG